MRVGFVGLGAVGMHGAQLQTGLLSLYSRTAAKAARLAAELKVSAYPSRPELAPPWTPSSCVSAAGRAQVARALAPCLRRGA
jgi:hypothetical protein